MKKLSNTRFVLLITVVASLLIVVFLSLIGFAPLQSGLLTEMFLLWNMFDQKYTGALFFLLVVLVVLLFRIIKAQYSTTKNLKIVLILFSALAVSMAVTYVGAAYYRMYLIKHFLPTYIPVDIEGIPPANPEEIKFMNEINSRLNKKGEKGFPSEVLQETKIWEEEQKKTQAIHPIYVADFAQDSILMGASHNVFVGRVIKQSGEKALGASPETQFKVEVISNIKGDLKGTVTVNQFGGYKNGKLVTVEDETNGTNSDPYLLQPGATYLFATRYHEQEDWYTLNSFPTARKLLSINANANIADLKTLAQNDERVKALTAAYPNEKLLDADIQHGNTRNSYHVLQKTP